MEGLEKCCRTVRPPRLGWRPVYARIGEVKPSSGAGDVANWLLAVVVLMSANFAIGGFLFLRHGMASALSAVAIIAAFALYRRLRADRAAA